jgi:PAS domain S-box-containing protein
MAALLLPIFYVALFRPMSRQTAEQEETEQQLRRENSEMRAVFQVSTDFYFLVGPDGNIAEFHRGGASDVYLMPEEYEGKLIQDILPPESGRRFSEAIRQAVETGGLVSLEYTGLRPHVGRVYEARLSTIPSGQLLAVCRDTTERRRAEEMLRHARDFAEGVIETAQAIVLVLDTQGRIVRFNPYMEAVSGYALAEVQGKDWFSTFLPERDRERIRTLFLKAIGDLQTRGNVNLIVTKDGCEREIEWHDKKLEDSDGNIVGLLAIGQDVTDRKLAEAERERLFEQVRAGREQLRELSRRLLEVQETERRALAREFHDEVGQAMTAVKINLEAAQRLQGNTASSASLGESLRIVEGVLQQVRDLSLDLRPLMLDDLGLVPALRWYVQRQAQRAGLTLHLEIEALDRRPPPRVETACFRIVQEALTNTMRHAQARNVWVELWPHKDELHLVVRDDGLGFDVEAARVRAAQGASLGLLGMQERAEFLNGTFEVESSAGHGTEIRAWFKLDLTRDSG